MLSSLSGDATVFVCSNADVREDECCVSQGEIGDAMRDAGMEVAPGLIDRGARNLVMDSYQIGRFFYSLGPPSKMRSYGILLQYWHQHPHTGRKRRPRMDIDAMVALWKPVIVGLATAHDKDEADRYERQLDACLSPILTAPIRDVRMFAGRLMTAMKDDKAVPFLVWRAFEVWVKEFVEKAPDGELGTLKTEIAGEIAQMVEADLQPQLSTALVHALQWRSAKKLEEVKEVVVREKAEGRKPRLKGRESCLFMECGGTDEQPEVVIQI